MRKNAEKIDVNFRRTGTLSGHKITPRLGEHKPELSDDPDAGVFCCAELSSFSPASFLGVSCTVMGVAAALMGEWLTTKLRGLEILK